MRAGRQLRAQQRDATATCPRCAHLLAVHREAPAEIAELVDGAIVVRPNPVYVPLVFGCDSCGCSIDRRS